jgi:hypothetical protein
MFSFLGYIPAVHPGIAHVFQSAAMRFGHTMVTPGVMRRYWELASRNRPVRISCRPCIQMTRIQNLLIHKIFNTSHWKKILKIHRMEIVWTFIGNRMDFDDP